MAAIGRLAGNRAVLELVAGAGAARGLALQRRPVDDGEDGSELSTGAGDRSGHLTHEQVKRDQKAFDLYIRTLESMQRAEKARALLGVRSRNGQSAARRPTLRSGSRGPAVVEVQERLNSRGTEPPLTTDGHFGKLTQAAVVAFQTAKGLAADGVVGKQTWAALAAG